MRNSNAVPDYVVYLQRRDSAAQVVSYVKAMQTGAWFTEAKGAGDTDLATADFTTAARLLLEQRRAWNDIFARTRTSPLLVWYEDVLEHRPREVARIEQFVGLSPSSGPDETQLPSVMRHRSDSQAASKWKNRAATALQALKGHYPDVYS